MKRALNPAAVAARVMVLLLAAVSAAWTGLNVSGAIDPVTDEAYRVMPHWRSLARVGHQLGQAGAPVEIAMFSDYQCPACRALWGETAALLARHRGLLSVLVFHFLLAAHPQALDAALAAECAAAQGRFPEYHASLFAKQDSLALLAWSGLAAAAGVSDTSMFTNCVGDPGTKAIVDQDVATAGRFYAGATPIVLLGDSIYRGLPRGFARLATDRVGRAAGRRRSGPGLW